MCSSEFSLVIPVLVRGSELNFRFNTEQDDADFTVKISLKNGDEKIIIPLERSESLKNVPTSKGDNQQDGECQFPRI